MIFFGGKTYKDGIRNIKFHVKELSHFPWTIANALIWFILQIFVSVNSKCSMLGKFSLNLGRCGTNSSKEMKLNWAVVVFSAFRDSGVAHFQQLFQFIIRKHKLNYWKNDVSKQLNLKELIGKGGLIFIVCISMKLFKVLICLTLAK